MVDTALQLLDLLLCSEPRCLLEIGLNGLLVIPLQCSRATVNED